MKFFLPLLLAALAPSSSAQEIISVHGSGTTNPQKCYWSIMDTLNKQSKLPVRLTYRGVGSSTGQHEFIGNVEAPFNDFGSGDIPIDQEDFDQFAPGSILHLPVLMGAISFFHSVPTDGDKLNLTPCVLAKILDRQITDWMDSEIVDLNPDLDLSSPYPINVAHRVKGSSSTASITAYLHQVCPAQWPQTLVGKTIQWKTDTLECEGSGGMTTCIRDQPGTIGYIDAGHGHSEGLNEIDLMNADGQYISSKSAAERNGILAALTKEAGLPAELDESFANVNLLNQAGAATWPIVALSYIYVRKDLSYLGSADRQNLLKGFLKAVYMDDYTQACASEFGFVPVTGDWREKALAAINNITVGGTEWFFEQNTEKEIGQKDYVFSVKRDSYSEIEQDALVRQVEALQRELDEIHEGESHDHMGEFERDQEITAALALGAISFTLWVFALICFLVKFVLNI